MSVYSFRFQIDFWKEPVSIGTPVDMMLSPRDFDLISRYFKMHSLEFSSVIDNVGDAVMRENERHIGTLFSTYSGFDYGRYHTLDEV